MSMNEVAGDAMNMDSLSEEVTRELCYDAARLVIERAKGPLTSDEEASLRATFKAGIPDLTAPYHFQDLAGRLEGMALTGLAAAFNRDGDEGTGLDGLAEHRVLPSGPGVEQWVSAFRDSAERLTEKSFGQAAMCFREAMPLEGTQYLKAGVISSMAAIAALNGWAFTRDRDYLNAVIGLATGVVPQEEDDLYEILQSASDKGQMLNSAFAAAMGQPDEVMYGSFYDSASGSDDDAIFFARMAVDLARDLAGDVLAKEI